MSLPSHNHSFPAMSLPSHNHSFPAMSLPSHMQYHTICFTFQTVQVLVISIVCSYFTYVIGLVLFVYWFLVKFPSSFGSFGVFCAFISPLKEWSKALPSKLSNYPTSESYTIHAEERYIKSSNIWDTQILKHSTFLDNRIYTQSKENMCSAPHITWQYVFCTAYHMATHVLHCI
jgi:hypothetical protein